MLDQLRAARKLPEEQDFREWKAALHEAYRATEAREHLWHLPDGRTLRVVTTPNPQGGVTYLFDDVTERLRAGAPLRRADPRAAARRSTIWPRRSRCSAATAGCGCTIRPSPPCGG